MKVVILCGGQGTRLREYTEFKPKPLVEIGGRPILWHVMKLYAHYGFREFVLCLGYRGDLIRDYFLNYETRNQDCTVRLGGRSEIRYHGSHDEEDFVVTLADTGQETMTGGRVKRIERYIDTDSFLLTYADGLADIDLRALVAFHQSHGRTATVTAVRPASRYGVLDVDGEGAVRGFIEKPQMDFMVSGGFFVFRREIFRELWDGGCVLEREPLENIARTGQLRAYRHEGFFCTMDTYQESLQLNQRWAAGDAPWRIWDRSVSDINRLADALRQEQPSVTLARQ